MRDLDLLHLGVESCLHEESDQVVERLVGEMQQDVPLLDRLEYRSHLIQVGDTHRCRNLLHQGGSYGIGQLGQILQVQVASPDHQIVPLDVECFAHKVQEIIRHGTVIHETAQGTDFPFTYLFLQAFHQFRALLVFQVDVRIT